MATKPTIIPEWATDDVNIINAQGEPIPNVLTPPDAAIQSGWVDRFPRKQWFNWLGRYVGDWVKYLKERDEQITTSDGNGSSLFIVDDSLITLHAVDIITPANYIYAVGFKGSGSAPVLNVISNNVLTLGTGTISGDQPISGGTPANVITYGQSRK